MTLTMLMIVAGFVTATPDTLVSRLPLRTPQERIIAPISGKPVIDAGIGGCSTDFLVKDGTGHPIASATIQMRIRYGLMGLRRMELAVGTGADGRARIQGLPDSSALLLFDIGKGSAATQVHQDLARSCRGRYDVTLK